jgi:hypothetical protein
MKKIILFLGFLLIPVSVYPVYPFTTSVDVGISITGYPPPDPAVTQALEKAKDSNKNNAWQVHLSRSNSTARISVEMHGNTKIITVNY